MGDLIQRSESLDPFIREQAAYAPRPTGSHHR